MEWRELTLKDACLLVTDGSHNSPKSVSHGLPMASVKDLTPYGITLETCRLISEEDFHRLAKQDCRPQKGDVLIAKDGATALDTVCEFQQDFEVILLSSVAILRSNPDIITPTFLRYYLDSPVTRAYMKSGFVTGAAIPRVVLEDFKRIIVRFPPLPVQRKIADVLSAYDDLIEVNTRRISILEQMAQSEYLEWFGKVDAKSLHEGWHVKTFGEVSENFDYKRIPVSSMEREKIQGEYPYYGASGIIDYVNEYIFDGRYLLIAEDGENLDSRKTPIAFFANGKFWVNNHAHIIQAKPPITLEFLYLFFANNDISGFITGAAQPKLSQQNLNRIPIVVPPQELMEKFNNLAQPAMQGIELLQRKNANLRRMRDLLLPRLVSGEVRV